MRPIVHACLFCGGDVTAPDHWAHCDGRQGYLEAVIEMAAGPVLESALAEAPIPHNGTDTSIAAARSLVDDVETLRSRVLEAIRRRPSTCDELETTLDLSHQTCSARVWELRRLGLVVDSGDRRRTRSGRAAKIWTRIAEVRS